MAIVCKYIQMPDTPDAAIKFLDETMRPLLQKYWEQRGQKLFDADMTVKMLPFVQMWLNGVLVVVIAYEGKEPVGFILGIRFSHLLYETRSLQVEFYHADTDETESALFKYLQDISGFMDINELLINTEQPVSHIAWKQHHTETIRSYRKG